MLVINDLVKLNGCPFDEQIPEELVKYCEVKDKTHKIIEIKDTKHIAGTSDQCVKTDLLGDEWIDSVWFTRI